MTKIPTPLPSASSVEVSAHPPSDEQRSETERKVVGQEIEEWRSVEGWEGIYDVSSLGRVRSLSRILCNGSRWKGRILRHRIDKKGYANVCLARNNTKTDVRVGYLVAFAFIGVRPRGMELAHKDGIKLNNSVSNLLWCTHIENESHKVAHGTVPTGSKNGKYTKPEKTPRGTRHGCHKLSEDQVIEIRRLRSLGLSTYKIGPLFNVTKQNIEHIVNRRIWTHI